MALLIDLCDQQVHNDIVFVQNDQIKSSALFKEWVPFQMHA